MLVALTNENWVDIAQGRGPILGHFDPDSCQHIKYNMADASSATLLVEESLYREQSQICHSARTYVLMLMR